MQRIAQILAAVILAVGLFGADTAFGRGGWGYGGGWGGGWHGGWGGGGWRTWGWGGYPYYGYGFYDWPYDYGYGYGYPYDYGYPPPQAPATSAYCATRTQVCVLHRPRQIGAACSCQGSRGRISSNIPR